MPFSSQNKLNSFFIKLALKLSLNRALGLQLVNNLDF